MNRDRYSILLNKAKHVIEINMQNVTGKWERTPVHEDVVKGFLFCKCILVLVHNANPAQQQHTRLIDSWDKLLTVHHQRNAYRLLPLRCQSVSAFAAMLAICSTSASPFHIDHRIDHVPYRCALSYKSPVRVAVEKYFKCEGVERLPFDKIDSDAVMMNDHAFGFVQVRGSVSPFQIAQFQRMVEFVTSPGLFDNTGIDPVPWKVMLARKHRFCFLASETPVAVAQEKQMAQLAKEAGIIIYHRKGNDFAYIGD